MKLGIQAIALSFLVSSCAASEDSQSTTASPPAPKPVVTEEVAPPDVAPEPPKAPATAAITPSIASAKLAQDCPDPKPASAANADVPKAGAPARRSRRKGSGSFRQPCTQSSVQIAFSKTGESGANVVLKEVRLLSADGQNLAPLAVRMPTRWSEQGGYEAWDGMLAPNAEEKASYKLSLPDWSAVEKNLGKSSYGAMFMLEVDVDIAGTVSTIRSPQFERSRPQIIRT